MRRCWHFALLLVEHMRREGVIPNKFVYDELCKLLDAAVSMLPLCISIQDATNVCVSHARMSSLH